MMLLASLLHGFGFGFGLPFWECDQERHEAFNLKSSTNAVEGLVEHEGVESFLNGLSLRKFKTIEVFENGDRCCRAHFIAGIKEPSGYFRIPFSFPTSNVHILSLLR